MEEGTRCKAQGTRKLQDLRTKKEGKGTRKIQASRNEEGGNIKLLLTNYGDLSPFALDFSSYSSFSLGPSLCLAPCALYLVTCAFNKKPPDGGAIGSSFPSHPPQLLQHL